MLLRKKNKHLSILLLFCLKIILTGNPYGQIAKNKKNLNHCNVKDSKQYLKTNRFQKSDGTEKSTSSSSADVEKSPGSEKVNSCLSVNSNNEICKTGTQVVDKVSKKKTSKLKKTTPNTSQTNSKEVSNDVTQNKGHAASFSKTYLSNIKLLEKKIRTKPRHKDSVKSLEKNDSTLSVNQPCKYKRCVNKSCQGVTHDFATTESIQSSIDSCLENLSNSVNVQEKCKYCEILALFDTKNLSNSQNQQPKTNSVAKNDSTAVDTKKEIFTIYYYRELSAYSMKEHSDGPIVNKAIKENYTIKSVQYTHTQTTLTNLFTFGNSLFASSNKIYNCSSCKMKQKTEDEKKEMERLWNSLEKFQQLVINKKTDCDLIKQNEHSLQNVAYLSGISNIFGKKIDVHFLEVYNFENLRSTYKDLIIRDGGNILQLIDLIDLLTLQNYYHYFFNSQNYSGTLTSTLESLEKKTCPDSLESYFIVENTNLQKILKNLKLKEEKSDKKNEEKVKYEIKEAEIYKECLELIENTFKAMNTELSTSLYGYNCAGKNNFCRESKILFFEFSNNEYEILIIQGCHYICDMLTLTRFLNSKINLSEILKEEPNFFFILFAYIEEKNMYYKNILYKNDDSSKSWADILLNFISSFFGKKQEKYFMGIHIFDLAMKFDNEKEAQIYKKCLENFLKYLKSSYPIQN